MSANQDISLPTLLAYPYFWNPEKFIKFVNRTWQIISDKKDKKKKKNHLDEVYRNLSLDPRNWIDELGANHWEILRQTEKANKPFNPNGTLFTELLRLVRNKYQHRRSLINLIKLKFENLEAYSAAVADIKCWFDSKNELITEKFVAFWFNKFPSLFPFFYVICYEYRDYKSLKDFYWSRTDSLDINYVWNMNKYITKFKNSLVKHLEEGSLLERYQYEDGPEKGVLEIRVCRELHNIVIQKEIVFIEVNNMKNGSLAVKHFLEDGSFQIMQFNGLDLKTKSFNMIFTENPLDSEVWKFSSMFMNRVIVFGKEYMESVGQEFIQEAFIQENQKIEIREFPLTWDEVDLLSPSQQEQIFDEGKILIQGREVLIKHILTTGKGLSGSILYQLLQNETPQLFSKYQLPKREAVYLERKLRVGGDIELEMLLKCAPNDIFIVSNINSEMLTRLKSNEIFQSLNGTENQKLVEVESFEDINIESGGKFYLLKKYEGNFDKIIEKCDWSQYQGSVHHIHFGKHGISHLFKTAFASCRTTEMFHANPEDQFLEKILQSNIEPIIFVAPPGSGKSQLFASLAEKLTSKSFVINISMRDFADKIRKHIQTRNVLRPQHIKPILTEIICSNDSEKFIISEWLDQKNRNYERIELMIDGFDELPDKSKEYCLKPFQVIQLNMPRIRLWVTSREGPQYGADKVSFFPCTLEPFSENDQITFIWKYWCDLQETEMSDEETTLTLNIAKHLLQQFREKLGTEIIKTPLHCRVLAEYYEDKIEEIASNPAEIILSIADLYEKLVNKMFKVYLDKGYKFPVDLNGTFLIKNFLLMHTYLSVKLLLLDEKDDKFKVPMIKDYLLDEAYRKMRIVTCINPLIFNHRTFAEFFIARFICQVLENSFDLSLMCSVETFQELMTGILTNSQYKTMDDCPVVLNFLNDLLGAKDVTKLATDNAYKPNLKNDSILSCLKIAFRHKLEKVSWLILNMWSFGGTDEFHENILTAAESHKVRAEFMVELRQLFGIYQNGNGM